MKTARSRRGIRRLRDQIFRLLHHLHLAFVLKWGVGLRV